MKKENAKHTPGPWSYCSETDTVCAGCIEIADMVHGTAPDGELIAAAPELLAALKALRQNGTLAQKMTPAEAFALADAAIAKAEGR